MQTKCIVCSKFVDVNSIRESAQHIFKEHSEFALDLITYWILLNLNSGE